MNKKRLYKRVNKAIRKVMGYMYSIENVWNNPRNLKLYDVSYHADDIIKEYPLLSEEENGNDAFYDFCDVSYMQFKEEFEQGFLSDMRVYVGRTSTFFITDIGGYRERPVNVLYNLLNELAPHIDFEFNDDLTIKPLTWSDYYTENELILEYMGDFEYIIEDFLENVKKYMKNAVELAQYIDSFKEKQIDIFKEYCAGREEDLQYQREQEQKQAIENKIDLGAWAICYAL